MEIVAVVSGIVIGLLGGVKGPVELVRWLHKRGKDRKQREMEISLMRDWVDAMGKVKTRSAIR